MAEKICWVLSNGRAGTENQCVGLAEAVGLPYVIKQVRVRPPWKWLPPRLWMSPLDALAADSDPLEPPWPDLLIASGRTTEALAVAIREASHQDTAQGRNPVFTVYLQAPSHSTDSFDLLAPPKHDRVRGSNVVQTEGALHRVTDDKLAGEARRVAASLEHLPRPLIAVLIGGTGNAYRMTPAAAKKLGRQLCRLTEELGAGLAVTVSRRTGPDNEAALREGLADAPMVVWDGTGENPYFGFLGLADAIVVTVDSISMTSESCATGKPVYVADLPGGSAKFKRFHSQLREGGLTRPFAGTVEKWTPTPLDDTSRVAGIVRQRLNLP